MFPSAAAMKMSCQVTGSWWDLFREINALDLFALSRARTEVEYFDQFFEPLERQLDGKRFGTLLLRCRTKRVHQKPIVEFAGTRCELGDYFINVKYFDSGHLLGRKLVVYQVKRSSGDGRWDIDPTQLRLLSDWPRFQFGRKDLGNWSFSLNPRTPDLGTYWLANLGPEVPFSVATTAPSVSQAVRHSRFEGDGHRLLLRGAAILCSQLAWRYGELIELNSPAEQFLSAMYRYVGFAEDPPDEFEGFSSERGPFWGMEITVSTNEDFESRGD